MADLAATVEHYLAPSTYIDAAKDYASRAIDSGEHVIMDANDSEQAVLSKVQGGLVAAKDAVKSGVDSVGNAVSEIWVYLKWTLIVAAVVAILGSIAYILLNAKLLLK